MNVAGQALRSIWPESDGRSVAIIDQTLLPHQFATVRLASFHAAVQAIRTMQVRGAPLIGATAAYGLALALRDDPSDTSLEAARSALLSSRPTAVNLAWALARVHRAVADLPGPARFAAAWAEAGTICTADIAANRALGEHGWPLLAALAERRPTGSRVNLLTHCNAGWLATVDGGTALSPVYLAHDRGLSIHVWVDETRPRNQGASLTAWELSKHGVPHTIVTDNAGGHLLQRGHVDAVIVGADRVAANGDVANKIGTYLKALAARDCSIPFYVAVPSSSIDWSLADGSSIPVEERPPTEVTHLRGADAAGQIVEVRLTPPDSPAANPAFDITPARLVTALITERGVCPASPSGLRSLYPADPPAPRSTPASAQP